jgi:hypothetical protein
MPVADINRVGARVCWTIGARGDSFTFEVEDDRYTLREIETAIVEAEAELVEELAENTHPHRRSFLQWIPTGGMDNGTTLPAHLGKIEAVRILAVDDESESEGEEDYDLAEPTTRSNVRAWREDAERDAADRIFGDQTAGYYNLTNDLIEFVGAKAQVLAVVYAPDYGPGESGSESESESESEDDIVATLQVPDQWEGDLVNGAVKRLGKDGTPPALILHASNQWDACVARIRREQTASPEIDQKQTIDG